MFGCMGFPVNWRTYKWQTNWHFLVMYANARRIKSMVLNCRLFCLDFVDLDFCVIYLFALLPLNVLVVMATFNIIAVTLQIVIENFVDVRWACLTIKQFDISLQFRELASKFVFTFCQCGLSMDVCYLPR